MGCADPIATSMTQGSDDPKPAIDRTFLHRYVTGEASREESLAVEAWALERPAHAAELEAVRATWVALDGPPGGVPYALDAGWDRFHATVVAPAQPTAPGHVFVLERKNARRAPHVRPLVAGKGAWWRPAAIAASVLVVLAVGLAVGAQRRGTGGRQPGREYATVAAQRLNVTLADGTQLTLAPASRLRLARDYGGSRRDVYLDGEAYFAVRHDTARPFAVHAAAAVAEDIGTRFDVRSYRGDSAVRVVVAEGAVGVSVSRVPAPAPRGSTPVIVKAGDLALVGSSGLTRVTSGVDPEDYLAWRDGRLVFRDTPLRDVVQMLGRWYGVNVQIGDATLAPRAFTATFASEPLQEALGAMCASLQLRYEARGTALVLYPLAHSGR